MTETINLFHETLNIMSEYGKSPENVEWVGSEDGDLIMSWMEFTKVANFEYDNASGGMTVAADIVVVGKDWWLERHDSLGAEWWEFKTLPKCTRPTHSITIVAGESYSTLKKMNSSD